MQKTANRVTQQVPEQATSARSTAERQAALRQRRAEEGLTEVRGLYVKPEHHAKVKAFAKSLEKKKVSVLKAS